VLTSLSEHGVQGTGRRGEHRVVDGSAVSVGRGAQLGEIGTDGGEPPTPTGRSQERARGGGRRVHASARGERCRHGAHGCRESGQAAQSGSEGVGGEKGPRRPRPGERPRGSGRGVVRTGGGVDEVLQDREPGDAVGDHVVEHDDQPDAPAGEPGDDCRGPQRSRARQRVGDDLGSEVEQRLLVAGGRAA
jgi:hypothetical protein